jgi:hypothetical protein
MVHDDNCTFERLLGIVKSTPRSTPGSNNWSVYYSVMTLLTNEKKLLLLIVLVDSESSHKLENEHILCLV